ncbi:MAG: U32 family peptidase [Rikenellaceae bacterium]
MNKVIELLAPAKNLEYGLEAIACGADAVYIGAPQFGARSAATNTIEDIQELVKKAHIFGVKVFVTLNTILFEEELEQAKALALELCRIGVDAFIVQDMAYCTFNLPIPLHASTQAALLTTERVSFFKKIGFERVVLERATSLKEIDSIHKNVNVELEAFVHGAICVSQSGQCYLGYALSGRSGNRGVCSQPCRSRYNLIDENGNVLIKDKHLLSLQDLELCGSLKDMIKAGVTSFKIEGRLKDISYLKNTVLHYRRRLDEIIAGDPSLERSSFGKTTNTLSTDLSKGFSRGATTYYLNSLQKGVSSFDTAKAKGEYIGEVAMTKGTLFSTKNSSLELHNGDGICFLDKNGVFSGTNINNVNGNVIEPNRMDGIEKGIFIYRNYDHRYISALLKNKVERKIKAKMDISFSDDKIALAAISETGAIASMTIENTFEKAKNIDMARETIKRAASKGGDTIFSIEEVTIEGDVPFIPSAEINTKRRELLEKLTAQQKTIYKRPIFKAIKPAKMGDTTISYKGNVTNSAARNFYTQCGVTEIEEGVELKKSLSGVELMRTKYCILREIDKCRKKNKDIGKLYLENGGTRLPLEFDCKKCEMVVLWD